MVLSLVSCLFITNCCGLIFLSKGNNKQLLPCHDEYSSTTWATYRPKLSWFVLNKQQNSKSFHQAWFLDFEVNLGSSLLTNRYIVCVALFKYQDHVSLMWIQLNQSSNFPFSSMWFIIYFTSWSLFLSVTRGSALLLCFLSLLYLAICNRESLEWLLQLKDFLDYLNLCAEHSLESLVLPGALHCNQSYHIFCFKHYQQNKWQDPQYSCTDSKPLWLCWVRCCMFL